MKRILIIVLVLVLTGCAMRPTHIVSGFYVERQIDPVTTARFKVETYKDF